MCDPLIVPDLYENLRYRGQGPILPHKIFHNTLRSARAVATMTLRKSRSYLHTYSGPLSMKYLVHQFTPDRDICINVVRGRTNPDDRTRPDAEAPNTAICQIDALVAAVCQ